MSELLTRIAWICEQLGPALTKTAPSAVVASFLRAGYSLGSSNSDSSYYDAIVAVWATVEVNVSIIAACMPSYGPLFRKVRAGSYGNHSGPSYENIGLHGPSNHQYHHTNKNGTMGRHLISSHEEIQMGPYEAIVSHGKSDQSLAECRGS